MEFEQKVIIITGASSGIGEACALKFAKSGGLLCLVGRNIDNLKRIAHDCKEFKGNKPLIVTADIRILEDVERIVQETIKHFGKIDVLINNAGIMFIGGINEDVSKLDDMVATNNRGTYLVTQKCIPHLIETKGNIVIISSVTSSIAEPLLTAYSMTKAALDAFTRCVAVELGPKEVRINSVNPGPIYTTLYEKGGLPDIVCKKKFEEMKQYTPLKKVAETEDTANIVMFLASDTAKCITGSFHYVDGGLHLGVPALRV